MNDDSWFALTVAAAVGCGLNAGVFFGFSSFVMGALARLPPAQAVAAMQSINVAAVTLPFMSVFFGTGAACAVLAFRAAGALPSSTAGFALAGSALYLAGSILVTVLFNVPLNNRLATVDPASDAAAHQWAFYLRRWTAWNHLRTVACLGATALFTGPWTDPPAQPLPPGIAARENRG